MEEEYCKIIEVKENSFLGSHKVKIGDICKIHKIFTGYFPRLDKNLMVDFNETEEITRNEYMRELWKIENTTK